MTTFTFTDPSGRTHDVEGPAGATQEQAFQVLQQRLGAAAPAPAALSPMDVDPSAGMGAGEKLLVGAGAATDRAIRGVKSLFGAKDAQGAEDAALYQKHHPGGWATAGEIGADVAMSAIPVARAGGVLTKAAQLAKMGRAAPLAGTVAANAGWNAVTAPEDKGTAAALGAAGAAGGQLLGKTLSGLVTPTKEAAELIGKGARLTPGQAGGTGSFSNWVEQVAQSNPLASFPVTAARSRGLEDSASVAIKSVADRVAPGAKLTGSVADKVAKTHELVSSTYDNVLPKLSIQEDIVRDFGRGAVRLARAEAPLVSDKEAAKLGAYLSRRVSNVRGIPGEGVVKGDFLKTVDTELGSHARALSRSTDAEQKAASELWYKAQSQWRDLMAMSAPSEATTAKLQQANGAWRELLALEAALKSGGGEKIQARGLAKALTARKIGSGELANVSKDMMAVLPNTVLDSGTAGRALANMAPALLSPSKLATAAPVLAAGTVAGLGMGTKVGAKLTTGQYLLQKKLAEQLAKYPTMAGQIGRATTQQE